MIVDNTFRTDFLIAMTFGKEAVLDTFKRASEEWIHDVKMFTALTYELNKLCWDTYYSESRDKWSKLFSDLYYKAYEMGMEKLSEEDRNYFWRELD